MAPVLGVLSLKSSPFCAPVVAVRAITQPIQCDGEYGVWLMLPPTSQSVWVLPILTTAANGTTDTQRFGCVRCHHTEYVRSCCDALISDVIEEPPSTRCCPAPAPAPARSRGLRGRCGAHRHGADANDAEQCRIDGGGTGHLHAARRAAWCRVCTTGIVAAAPRYPTMEALDTRAKFAQNRQARRLMCRRSRYRAPPPARPRPATSAGVTSPARCAPDRSPARSLR